MHATTRAARVSSSRTLLFAALVSAVLIAGVDGALASSSTTTRASVDSSLTQADARSGLSDDSVAISGDGRIIAFDSDATNLVPLDGNARTDVFVHDRQTEATTRVSVSSLGVEGNGTSVRPSVSANGRFVVFRSGATNLVTGDTNGVDDIFVHDRSTGITVRVSVSSAGVQGDQASSSSAISSDGRYVAFVSRSTNLVAGDTNGVRDVFVHDRDADGDLIFDEGSAITTTRVSLGAGGAQGNGDSRAPALSGDGRYVVFDSIASNLVAADTNAVADVFVRDRATATTTRVSVGAGGAEANGASTEPVISGIGRFVMYQSDASNLVASDTNGVTDVFVHDRQSGATARISVSSSGVQANGASIDAAISPGGRFTAFRSSATNLVHNDANGRPDAFVFDRQTGAVTRVSIAPAAVEADGDSLDPSVSDDGGIAVFASFATNLVGGDTNAVSDVFVRALTDRLPPVIQCSPDLTTACQGASGANVPYTATATDDCDPSPSIQCEPPSGSVFAVGTSTVGCLSVDASGNASVCSFTVTVTDGVPPSITCPANVTVECETSAGTPVSFGASAADACDASPTIECVPTSGTTFPPGVTTVTCTATDHSGNATPCSFDVHVVDTIAPTITCPVDPTVECASTAGTPVTFTPTATDGCDLSPTIVCVPTSGSLFALGSTKVLCTATDASGNSTACALNVFVIDTTPPAMKCPSGVTAECSSSSGTPVSFSVSAIDVCDASPAITCVPPSGSLFANGTTPVNCGAVDESGNPSGCSFSVVVVDTIPPVITCPASFTVECTSPAGATVTFSVTATDACDASPSILCVPASGSLFASGPTSVSCTATDAGDSFSTCSFTVTVADTIAPTISCPANLSTGCGTEGGAIVTFAPTTSDTCDAFPAVVCIPASGSVFLSGLTSVTCTATDSSANVAMCSFDVTVASTLALVRVMPSAGSESGNEYTSLIGCGFTDLADTTVLVGGNLATNIDVSSGRVRFRTPPGVGIVDVTLTNSNGSQTLVGGYVYVDPGLAARFGNVNIGVGDRVDVLSVAGSAGDSNREVMLGVGQPITIAMASSPGRARSRFAFYAWTVLPDATTLKVAPSDLGITVLPTPLTPVCLPQPRKIWNNLGFESQLGTPRFPSLPAPSVILSRAQGIPHPVNVAFQGIIRDDGSHIPQGFSVTNAVILRVVP